MTIIEQGGPLMWPLLGLSILACAVMLDRGIALSTFGFPAKGFLSALTEAVRRSDATALRALCADLPEALRPLLDVLFPTAPRPDRERAVRIMGEAVLHELTRRVGVLGLVVRAAPLLGLLGTVLGMISTFSTVAASGGGIDMAGLAAGIWQALITTAAGLGIAIPALTAQHWCNQRIDAVAEALEQLTDAVEALERTPAGLADAASPEARVLPLERMKAAQPAPRNGTSPGAAPAPTLPAAGQSHAPRD